MGIAEVTGGAARNLLNGTAMWPLGRSKMMEEPEMERFFAANYHVSEPDGVVPIGYRLLERN